LTLASPNSGQSPNFRLGENPGIGSFFPRVKPVFFLFGVLALVLGAFLAFGPRLFLKSWLNRDFGEESYFKKISAKEIELGLLLDNLTIKGLSLVGSVPNETLEIAEARIRDFSFWALIKASFGRGDWLAPLADSEIELRRVGCPGGLIFFKKASINTLGLKFSRAPSFANSPPYGLAYLKFTDLNLALAPSDYLDAWRPAQKLYFSLDSLALKDLSFNRLDNLILSGLRLDSGATSLSLGDLALDGLRPWELYERYATNPQNILSLLDSADSVELTWLNLNSNDSALTLAKGFWANPKEPADQGEIRLKVQGLALKSPAGLAPAFGPSDDPALLALFEALGQAATGDLSLSLPKAAKGRADFSLDLKDQGELKISFTGPGSFFKSLLTGRPSYGPLLSGFGPGEASYQDRGLARAWIKAYQTKTSPSALSDYLAEYQATLEGQGFLADPKALVEEIRLFLADPQSFALAWSPPAGFPLAAFKSTGGLRLLSEATGSSRSSRSGGSGGSPNELAQKYGYAVLKDLNLTLTVNGRSPWLFQGISPSAPHP
jgi:hypothetical protein